MADRGVAPVVGKALEAGIVVLYVGLVTATLYGGVVPDYRTGAGDAVGDRVLAGAAQRVEAAVPPNATAVSASARVPLPDTIRGKEYVVRGRNRSLVLDHPHPLIGGRVRLALPRSVTVVRGSWESREPAVVRVRGSDVGLVVHLGERTEGTPS